MTDRLLADLVVGAHFGFVIFAVFGGLLVLRWPKIAWIHLPAVAWAALVELAGWECPLTPLEAMLRERSGAAADSSSFLERWLLPVLYPSALTRRLQIVLGLLVLAINAGIYGWAIRRRSDVSALKTPGSTR